ncbi:MAG TPA: hypothetical protein GX707_08355, partial [Epulopiscium sp.]|nr:hypothetical protein [Candidatus Epulonipiscium sp.]
MEGRKIIAKIVAVLMMVTWIPVFAASTNGVDKIVTVREGATIESALAPELGIELKDKLSQGQQFYLKLENAEWNQDIVTQLGVNSDFIFERESKSRLMVEAKINLLANQVPYKIPLIAKITGDQATVEIISNETVVTSGKYTFAKSKDSQSMVSVDDPKIIASVGELSEISIEEEYTRAFKSNSIQTVTIELSTTGFVFNYSNGHIIADAAQGKRAYQGKKFDAKIIDPTRLEVEIPANSLNETQKGALDIAGIEIKATNNAVYGDIKAIISGDLNDSEELVVARYGDYATELKVDDDYQAMVGQPLKDVEFTLGEIVPDSFNGTRETTFAFSKDIEIVSVSIIKSEGLQTGAVNPAITIEQKDGINTNSFKMAGVMADNTKNTKLTFKATLKVPASFDNETINITAEGRSLENKKEAILAQVQEPVEVDISPITAKVGLAQQEGGKIVLTETVKGQLLPGKIFLAFDDEDIQYTKAPEVTVIEGNIRVDAEAKIITGGLEVMINGKSTKASTIEISGG